MRVPTDLYSAINNLIESGGRQAAVKNAPGLSRRYRGKTGPFIASYEDALAYALTRMPATYGAVYEVLRQTLAAAGGGARLKTLLDAGAGTGAAAWASCALLDLSEITCAEKSGEMRRAGESLSREGPPALRRAEWVAADITRGVSAPHDLVIAAYVLNEIPEARLKSAVTNIWDAAGQYALIVEPGTPDAFGLMLNIRGMLIDAGAHVIAPCPHGHVCPLAESGWCHFAARVPRGKAHKLAKGGSAPFEDEKFTYIAVSKQSPAPAQAARVLRRPYKGRGYVGLSLCGRDGIYEKTVSRGDSAAYARARSVSWGDAF